MARGVLLIRSSDNNSSSIVAIFAILILPLIGGLVAWQFGMFGGGNDKKDVNIHREDPRGSYLLSSSSIAASPSRNVG